MGTIVSGMFFPEMSLRIGGPLIGPVVSDGVVGGGCCGSSFCTGTFVSGSIAGVSSSWARGRVVMKYRERDAIDGA